MSADPVNVSGHRTSEPVFFDDHDGVWTLRYRPEVIGRFGVPATALTERRPAPRQQGDDEPGPLNDTYVVACPAVRPGHKAPWGIWVELSPGHVLEIGGPLLGGPGLVALDNLPWEHFGPGDLITLETVRRNITEPRRLRLLDWKPGPRSALLPEPPPGIAATGRALLSVSNVDAERGCLRLGSGDYVLEYPVSPADADRYKPGYAVWLHRTNRLTSAFNATPACGDTGLLGLNRDGSLKLLALRGLRAEPSADPAGWPGSEWLGELLRGPRSENVLRALRGCLPVTIERVDGDVVVFSRCLQPSGEWPARRLLRCAVVGAVDSMLFLRSGGALFRLPVQGVVRGVPAAHAAAVARTLAAQCQVVWCQRAAHGGGVPQVSTLLSSSPGQPTVYPDEFDAVPLAAIDSDGALGGMLLRAVHDQGIRWMPADEATWLDQPTSAELRSFIVDSQLAIRVRSIHGGQVSAIQVRAVRHQRTSLTLGSAVRVEPCAPPQLDLSGRSTTVARVSATALLVRLVVGPEECPLHEPVLAEAAELGTADYPNAVQVVLHGQRLHPVDLPKRVATGTPGPAAREQDRLAAEYARWWNEGLQAGSGLAQIADKTTEDLLRATSSALTGQPNDPRIDQALSRWLDAYGEAAFNFSSTAEIELVPVLAACLLLARRGERRDDRTAKACAVLLAHQAGLRAARSMHVELITRHWLPLARGGTHAQALPVHARLAQLKIQKEMDREQLRAALWFGHGVLARVRDGSLDDGSAPIACAVLAAVGELTPGLDVARGSELLAPLAGLGRALHPPKGDAVAQAELLTEQVADLKLLLRRALELPVTLLPLPPRAVLDRNSWQLVCSLSV
jgi:hypothetical protein